MEFVIVNGEVVSKSKANLTSFVWNDPYVLAQKVWYGYGGIPLFNENLSSIEEQLSSLNKELPAVFSNKRELYRLSKRMLNKNKFYRSGYLNYQLFISEKKINTLVTGSACTGLNFPYSEKGLLVNFSPVKKNASLTLGHFPYYNQSLWRLLAMQIAPSNYEGTILCNEKGFVCEGLYANIFMVKDGVVITPSQETGCYCDVLRPVVLELCRSLDVQVLEIPHIEQHHLTEMDEIFFVSEAKGMQWVLGIENKRFVHAFSDKLHKKLNKELEHRTDR